MVQLWLPTVPAPPEVRPPARRRRVPLADQAELAARLDRRPSAAELAELAADLERQEWAADGGDGAIWSDDELGEAQCLDLEWMLNGSLIEAMAALELRVPTAPVRNARVAE